MLSSTLIRCTRMDENEVILQPTGLLLGNLAALLLSVCIQHVEGHVTPQGARVDGAPDVQYSAGGAAPVPNV